MSEEIMITQQDLIDWLNRPPSNDDLDLATFISTRLEKFYDLENQLQQKENIIKEAKDFINGKDLKENEYRFAEGFNFTKLLEILDKEKV